MEHKRPRWVDRPEFDWTPQPPLELPPPISLQAAQDIGCEPVIIDARLAEPPPDLIPANDTLPRSPSLFDRMRGFAIRAGDQTVTHIWQLGKQSGDTVGRLTLPTVAPRLAIGLGQGLLLCLLFYARDPGAGGLLTGLIMAATFAPLILIQGLGRISAWPLMIWTGCAAFCLAGLGAYHAWRITGADPGHAGLWLATMIAGFLFIGQALLLAHTRNGPGPLRYAVLYESSWRLAMETLLCGLFALLIWGLWSVFENWLALQARTGFFSRVAIPLVTFSFAVASQLRAGPLLHLLKRGSVVFLTMGLPLLILSATVTILVASLGHWQPPLALCGIEGVLLVAGINASYRGGGEWRPLWRRRAEFLAAFLLPLLAALTALALQTRVARFGFTAPRVVAAGCVLVLWSYALTYAGAALISLSGGRWMERIESANLMMAFVALSLLATLASPLGDPVRLAVANQNWRLGRIAPEAFDYDYLRRSGLRFGHDVLAGLARKNR